MWGFRQAKLEMELEVSWEALLRYTHVKKLEKEIYFWSQEPQPIIGACQKYSKLLCHGADATQTLYSAPIYRYV